MSLGFGPWAPCNTTHVPWDGCRMCANCQRHFPDPLSRSQKRPRTPKLPRTMAPIITEGYRGNGHQRGEPSQSGDFPIAAVITRLKTAGFVHDEKRQKLTYSVTTRRGKGSSGGCAGGKNTRCALLSAAAEGT